MKFETPVAKSLKVIAKVKVFSPFLISRSNIKVRPLGGK